MLAAFVLTCIILPVIISPITIDKKESFDFSHVLLYKERLILRITRSTQLELNQKAIHLTYIFNMADFLLASVVCGLMTSSMGKLSSSLILDISHITCKMGKQGE